MNSLRKIPLLYIFILVIVVILVLRFFFEKYCDIQNIEKFAPWLTAATAICALISANRVSEKWMDQHNKKLENEFGYKAYEAFEAFKSTIKDQKDAINKAWLFVPEEYRHTFDSFYLNESNIKKYNLDMEIVDKAFEYHMINESFEVMMTHLSHYFLVKKDNISYDNLDIIRFRFSEIYEETHIEIGDYRQMLGDTHWQLKEIIEMKFDIHKEYISPILRDLPV